MKGGPVKSTRRTSRQKEPEIAAAPAKEPVIRDEKIRITTDRILEEYARIAFADLRQFADWGPGGVKLRSKDELSDAEAAAIAEVQPNGSNGKGGKLKLYDKKAALDALARHLGLFDPKTRGPADQSPDRDAVRELRERLLRLARSGGAS